jgi:hypothetical protein
MEYYHPQRKKKADAGERQELNFPHLHLQREG